MDNRIGLADYPDPPEEPEDNTIWCDECKYVPAIFKNGEAALCYKCFERWLQTDSVYDFARRLGYEEIY